MANTFPNSFVAPPQKPFPLLIFFVTIVASTTAQLKATQANEIIGHNQVQLSTLETLCTSVVNHHPQTVGTISCIQLQAHGLKLKQETSNRTKIEECIVPVCVWDTSFILHSLLGQLSLARVDTATLNLRLQYVLHRM